MTKHVIAIARHSNQARHPERVFLREGSPACGTY